ALIALVKAHELCGQPDQALVHMHDLMQHLSRRRQEQLDLLMAIEPAIAAAGREEYLDLHMWKYREARLRAAAAEREVISARYDMLERLAITAGLKEDPSGEHGYRVGRLSALLAQSLGWSRDNCHLIEIAARLHDIGKVGIPDRILLGSHELKEAERHFMRSHTLMGAELLAKSDVPQMKMAEDVARFHHEWWDGTGYPSSLSGGRIPLHARVVALADVFDALTHGRPYAEAWTQERAFAEIDRLAGTQFDPQLTPQFISLVRELSSKHYDLDAFLGRAAQESAFLVARRNLKVLMNEEARISAGRAA
ncbi:MAG TPA: HD domain-containing phosphohydrolase, partial [Usitatibacter sp.]|nr:HD domain-containing phosphohydrolase [Usitatibacter sp.]